jgi:hypothetical protein
MSKKVKKLTLQYAYLQVALEELKEICVNVEKEMREYLEKHYPQHYEAFFGPPTPYTPEAPPEVTPDEDKKDKKDEEEKPEEKDEEEEPGEKDDEESIPSPPKNKDLRKLYRKIAEKTHPDKAGSNKHAQLFSEAAAAYKENDIATLLNLAGILNIELLELSPESLILLENNIKTLAMKIHNKKQTTAWAWHQSKTEKKKESIIKQILGLKGIEL